jgi:2-polyprenyl-3-methyl-5-hydroxy-6-metoxy-1,4-benzoquinol methylase
MTKSIRQDPENSELDALHEFVGSFEGKRVLEIGCGNGRLTFQYAAEAALVHAIDPSEKKIAEARKNMPAHLQDRLEFFDVGIETFFAPEKYDTVLLAWSL